MIKRDGEIDLVEVVREVRKKRFLIVRVGASFLIVGILIAFTAKVEYKASCELLPESNEAVKSNLGGLGSLAGLVGINLDMSSQGKGYPKVELGAEIIIPSKPDQRKLSAGEIVDHSGLATLSLVDSRLVDYIGN